MTPISIQEITNRKNLRLLIMLRWLAVGGQIAAIAIVHVWFGITLPLVEMGCVILFLVGLNLVSRIRSRGERAITNSELFIELLFDVAALTAQLYLSGGATNPFISLFLLQVILGAVLLQQFASWTLVAITSFCFIWLVTFHRKIGLSMHAHMHDDGRSSFFDLHIQGMFICYLLAAVLVVLFVTRINRNLRERDALLAELRQQSVEEEHIVRMGLLASGAAHELGTPLGTLSVILNDWERMPALRANAEIGGEIGEMQVALARCKDIVSRILLAAGEARGEGAERTTLIGFLDDVVESWRQTRAPARLDYVNAIEDDASIASDTVIRQVLFNVFDNALEASPGWVGINASRRDGFLSVSVCDKGSGFQPDILARFGKPYQSTKGRPGSGLGLFLVVNVLRKLGGVITPENNGTDGATVELRLPVSALSIEGRDAGE
jgi:two-component system, sensor histidine kinase RegB